MNEQVHAARSLPTALGAGRRTGSVIGVTDVVALTTGGSISTGKGRPSELSLLLQ